MAKGRTLQVKQSSIKVITIDESYFDIVKENQDFYVDFFDKSFFIDFARELIKLELNHNTAN